MQYLEYIMAFLAGGSVCVMLGVIFSLNLNGIIKLALNLFLGASALVILCLLGIKFFALNALNCFLVGIFGVPGLAIVFALAVF